MVVYSTKYLVGKRNKCKRNYGGLVEITLKSASVLGCRVFLEPLLITITISFYNIV